MQNKPKKNLYKIIFLLIALSFIISLTGCDWLSGGIWNIFDPKAQIITEFNPEEGGVPAEGCCNAGASCINGVEFFITGFAYNYHGVDYVDGKITISELSRVLEASFYVAPSTSPGTPGPKTIIENIPLFFQDVIDYLYLHPFITEITCDLSLVGVDGAGHSLSFQIASELPIFEPGIDLYPPTAVISVTPGTTGTAPFAVVFDASGSFDIGSGIADINWDFGDESTGTDITENHTYDIPGAYSVNLTVTDFYGNKGYATVIIIVNEAEAPTAKINTTPSPPTGIAPFKVYFDAYESYADPECGFGCEIVSYEWEFGDGNTGTGVTSENTYVDAGIYIVYLTITDNNLNKGYATVTVTVNEVGAPTAVINTVPSPAEGIVPFEVYFDAHASSTEVGNITDYEWDFGDGNTGTGVTAENTYAEVGTYTAVLTVTDSNGKKGYDSIKIKVEKAPKAVINTVPSPPEGVAPFIVYFDAYESTSESGIVSYEWEFGDGDTGDGITVNHTYETAGTYIVYLTITDSNEYEAYDSVEVEVEEFESESEAEVIVEAEPETITPSGSSTITATCTDDSGNTVPNGTSVHFSTSDGVLTIISGTTTSGIATATLTMSNVGVALVSAYTIYAIGNFVSVTCE